MVKVRFMMILASQGASLSSFCGFHFLRLPARAARSQRALANELKVADLGMT
jgi:hypothetical protein